MTRPSFTGSSNTIASARRSRRPVARARGREIEKVVNHDVIAFLTNVSENVGPVGRYVHFGLTSSDILDTGLSLQVMDASNILIRELKKLISLLGKKAKEHAPQEARSQVLKTIAYMQGK